MNRQETMRLLAVLKSIWREQTVDDNLITAWTWALADLPADAVNAAAGDWMQTEKWMPKPAELRMRVIETVTGYPAPEEAWGEVMRQIRAIGSYGIPTWSCEPITRAVEALGWRTLCGSDEIGVERAHFFRTYDAYRQRALKMVDVSLFVLASGEDRLIAVDGEGEGATGHG